MICKALATAFQTADITTQKNLRVSLKAILNDIAKITALDLISQFLYKKLHRDTITTLQMGHSLHLDAPQELQQLTMSIKLCDHIKHHQIMLFPGKPLQTLKILENTIELTKKCPTTQHNKSLKHLLCTKLTLDSACKMLYPISWEITAVHIHENDERTIQLINNSVSKIKGSKCTITKIINSLTPKEDTELNYEQQLLFLSNIKICERIYSQLQTHQKQCVTQSPHHHIRYNNEVNAFNSSLLPTIFQSLRTRATKDSLIPLIPQKHKLQKRINDNEEEIAEKKLRIAEN